ncbi:MAG: hypothetical protein U9R48_01545 [Chloroflexota bacterium]|nr:hypothetical protein [Chloroflexota bacterium]
MKDWWQDYPWRLIQTNLREIDMLDIDAQRFMADLQAFKATVVLLNVGGIIASYSTELPFHFQSPFLEGDSLQEIISACHARDIKVLARTDFSKDIEVSLPFHYEAVSVESLVTGGTYNVDLKEDGLVIHVPKVELFDAIKIQPWPAGAQI